MKQQDSSEVVKKALVVYGGSDASLSNYVVSYLSGAALEGIVFSRRVDRYDFVSTYYDLVVVLNDAEVSDDNLPHVWNITTASYSQAKSSSYLTGYTFKQYLKDEAKATADKIVKKLKGGRF